MQVEGVQARGGARLMAGIRKEGLRPWRARRGMSLPASQASSAAVQAGLITTCRQAAHQTLRLAQMLWRAVPTSRCRAAAALLCSLAPPQVPWHAVLGNHDYCDSAEGCNTTDGCPNSPLFQVGARAGASMASVA